MTRMLTWKALAIVVILILAAALIALRIGNASLASALIVVAVVEGAFHAVALGVGAAKRRRAGGP